MNNTFSLQQLSQTGNLDSNLITRQYQLDLMARFMETKSVHPNLKQSEIAKELGCSNSTFRRYRQDINMLSPYRIPPKSFRRNEKISDREHHFKTPQLTSKDVTNENVKSLQSESKNSLQSGSLHKNIEIIGEYLDASLHNNHL